MSVKEILTAYDRLVDELSAAVLAEDWERLHASQDEIESLQQQFNSLPETEKQHPDVQNRLQHLLYKQQQLTERVAEAKQQAAQNIRKLKIAKTQQQGYLYKENREVPPVLYDRKS